MRNNGFISACSSFSIAFALAFVSGCGSSPAPAQSPWEADPEPSAAPSAQAPAPLASASPSFVPPTPASVSPKNPGGDAADPERAALERLAALHRAGALTDDEFRAAKQRVLEDG